MAVGRPRTSIPEKEEVIALGEDFVKWASEQTEKEDPIRVRYCDWYTKKGFVRKQWENMRATPEFSWYYELGRSYLGLRYVNGTVNPSIAHRYLRIYDPEVRDAEDETKRFEASLGQVKTDEAPNQALIDANKELMLMKVKFAELEANANKSQAG